jgi:hypothetical protein
MKTNVNPKGVNKNAKNTVQLFAWVGLLFIFLLETFAGKLCIEVSPTSKIAAISEELCIGCGICVKV